MNEQKYNCHERRLALANDQRKIKLAYAPDIGSDNYLEIIETDMQGNRKYINNDVDRCYNKTIKFTNQLRVNSVIDIWYNKKESKQSDTQCNRFYTHGGSVGYEICIQKDGSVNLRLINE